MTLQHSRLCEQVQAEVTGSVQAEAGAQSPAALEKAWVTLVAGADEQAQMDVELQVISESIMCADSNTAAAQPREMNAEQDAPSSGEVDTDAAGFVLGILLEQIHELYEQYILAHTRNCQFCASCCCSVTVLSFDNMTLCDQSLIDNMAVVS